ncbi:MAG: ribosome maturation factor RimP [Xanthomonadales bacterium]|nr:ribosome maturation factor RimP [Xanthomonadales bacterium]
MSRQNDVEQIIRPVVEDLGYEWVGMEFNPHPKNGLLRIYIDQPETGITVDDCARVSHEVSGLLDVHNLIPGHYNLEVSSPGLDRPLFTPADFERFAGHGVSLTVLVPIDGRRRFKGTISRVEDEQIEIIVDGEVVEIRHADVSKARLVPEL